MEKESKNNPLTESTPEIPGQGGAHAVSAFAGEAGKQNQRRTIGDRIVWAFNEIGINWVVNGLLSITLTYLYGEHIQPEWKKGFQSAAEKVDGAFGKKSAPPTLKGNLRGTARIIQGCVETAVMCIAGTVLVPPMIHIDNNKYAYADKIDRLLSKFGIGRPATEAEKEFRVDKQHRLQDILISRLSAVGIAIGSGMIFDAHSNVTNVMGEDGETVIEYGYNFDRLASKTQNFAVRMQERILNTDVPAPLEGIRNFIAGIFNEKTGWLFTKEYALTGILSLVMAPIKGLLYRKTSDREARSEAAFAQAAALTRAASQTEMDAGEEALPQKQWAKEQEGRKASRRERVEASAFSSAVERVDGLRQNAFVQGASL